MKKLFVGGLPWAYDNAKLAELFAPHGEVISATVIVDRDTGRSKGFGFVEMNDADAEKAIGALNGSQLDGRTITVNEARPMAERPRR